MTGCRFCEIASGKLAAAVVYEDEQTLAFLDHRPLFPGHVLLIPRTHVGNLSELPDDLAAVLFLKAKLMARAVEDAVEAQGSFVAINNKVSQSVPHLHVHVVPRSKGDGLRGFFWPRSRYSGEPHIEEIRGKIAEAVHKLSK